MHVYPELLYRQSVLFLLVSLLRDEFHPLQFHRHFHYTTNIQRMHLFLLYNKFLHAASLYWYCLQHLFAVCRSDSDLPRHLPVTHKFHILRLPTYSRHYLLQVLHFQIFSAISNFRALYWKTALLSHVYSD